MTLEEWKGLFKASIAQRRWNIYPPTFIAQVVGMEDKEESIPTIKQMFQSYESLTVSSSGTNGGTDPLSPKSLVKKLGDVVITPPAPPPETLNGKSATQTK